MASTRRPSNHRTRANAALTVAMVLLLQLSAPSGFCAAPLHKDTTDGLDYSLDRLAFEVTKSLADRPALVIWLFDESASVGVRRQSIVHQLEQLWPAIKRPNPLYSAIVGFGKDIHFLTPEPVKDFPSLKQAADRIQQDDSGVETVFDAVISSLDEWQALTGQDSRFDISLVIVTDEVGDDQERLEDAIRSCKERGVRVFCLGNAAPFGQSKGLVPYRYADGFKDFIPVDQRPEVAIPETLRLPIWPSAESDPLNQVSSGFGPWALSRLCNATGGKFFIAEDTGSPRFPRAAMADYTPCYEPLEAQRKAIEENQLRRTLAECSLRVERQLKTMPRFTFRADKASTARAELTRTQKQAAILSLLSTTSADTLRKCIEERESVTDKRVEAAFDLAYGRALLQAARAAELNYALAKKKVESTEFSNERSNTWTLEADPTAKPMRQQADLVRQAPLPFNKSRSSTPTRHSRTLQNRNSTVGPAGNGSNLTVTTKTHLVGRSSPFSFMKPTPRRASVGS